MHGGRGGWWRSRPRSRRGSRRWPGAAETFAQALTDRSPRPVRIGGDTQGVFPDTLERRLPGGWSFTLPNERCLTRDGRSFDGAGLPPDLPTPVCTDDELDHGRDAALDRAPRWFGAR